MIKELHVAMDGTISELVELVSSLGQEEINLIPYEGSWTAGQLAKHVIMSNSGFLEMVNGPVKETERAPDQLVGKIKGDFLNLDIKMQSPDFVMPPKTSFQKEDLLGSLQEIKLNAIESIDTLELDKTCLSFELPGYGFLTRLEAISFILYHTQRHIHQLKNINKVVSLNKNMLQPVEQL